MKKAELVKLMEKIGMTCPKNITISKAEDSINKYVETNGILEEVLLEDKEIDFLEEIGFDMSLPDEDDDWDEEDIEEVKEDIEEEDIEEEDIEEEDIQKPNVSRSERKQKILDAITDAIIKSENGLTRQEIVETVLEELPDTSTATIKTYISDGKNEKYCQFKSLLTEDDKHLSFNK